MAVRANGTERAGSTLARYLDDTGEFLQESAPASAPASEPTPYQAPSQPAPGMAPIDTGTGLQPWDGSSTVNAGGSATFNENMNPATGPAPAQPFVSQWDTGASAPSNAPVGQHWDPSMANYAADTTATTTPAAAPAGNDAASQIDALYAKYGISDGGRGSGFADRAYWLEHPSEILNGRLAADLAGTGSDQPTGTPGTGPWSTSGAGARGGAASSAYGAALAPPATGGAAAGGASSQSGFDIGSYTQQLLASLKDWNKNPALDAVRKIIMDRLAQYGGPVNEDQSGITQAVTGARDEATRATEKERAQLAESLYASGGLNTEAVPRYIQQSGERNATALGSLRANLVMGAYRQKQQEFQQLLSYAIQSGDQESARNIQTQMAALDAALRDEGFGVDLAKTSAQLNQNAALAGLNG